MRNSLKKRKYYFRVVFFAFLVTTMVLPYYTAKAYKEIKPIDVKSELNSPMSKMILIDVRTPEEYASGHIDKSTNIPIQIFEEEMKAKNYSKNSFIVVYCKSGVRSKKAAQILDSLGFTNIYSLGGIIDWPYEITQK